MPILRWLICTTRGAEESNVEFVKTVLKLPAIKILLDVLQTKALRQDLSTLPGYESSMMGKIVGEF